MLFESAKVGTKLDIKTPNIANASFVSKIVDIIDVRDQVVSIYAPVAGVSTLKMEHGITYTVQIYSSSTAYMEFPAVFVGRYKEGQHVFYKVRLLGDGKRVQRRDFFRFTCLLAMKFSVMDFEESDDPAVAAIMHSSGYVQLHDAVIRDIGGGGLRFITNEELSTVYPISCTIALGDTVLTLKAQLLDHQVMPSGAFKYQYRAKFIEVRNSEREEIVNYIFAEQRKQRKLTQGVEYKR